VSWLERENCLFLVFVFGEGKKSGLAVAKGKGVMPFLGGGKREEGELVGGQEIGSFFQLGGDDVCGKGTVGSLASAITNREGKGEKLFLVFSPVWEGGAGLGGSSCLG